MYEHVIGMSKIFFHYDTIVFLLIHCVLTILAILFINRLNRDVERSLDGYKKMQNRKNLIIGRLVSFSTFSIASYKLIVLGAIYNIDAVFQLEHVDYLVGFMYLAMALFVSSVSEDDKILFAIFGPVQIFLISALFVMSLIKLNIFMLPANSSEFSIFFDIINWFVMFYFIFRHVITLIVSYMIGAFVKYSNIPINSGVGLWILNVVWSVFMMIMDINVFVYWLIRIN